ncbi:MAG: DUF3987 domain-containing protein [Chitinophagales bacterium]
MNIKMSYADNIFEKVTKKYLVIQDLVTIITTGRLGDHDFRKEISDCRSRAVVVNNENYKDEIREIKKKIPCFYPSGFYDNKKICSENFPDEYSGIIQLDYDFQDNETLFKSMPIITELRKRVMCFPFIIMCAVSPSGNGLKMLAYIGSEAFPHHKIVYKQVTDFIKEKFKINADPSCSDISRSMLFTYDPYAEFNLRPQKFEYKIPESTNQNTEQLGKPTTESEEDTLQKVKRCVDEIVDRRLNIAHTYPSWDANARSLASLGESGREPFHMIAKQSPKYKQDENDEKFSYYLNKGTRATIGTFFFHCKQHGLTIKNNNMTEANELKFRMIGNETEKEEIEIFSPPALPDHLFEQLPTMLDIKHLGDISAMEKSLYVLSVIQANSTLLDNVEISHDKNTYFVNLYLFGVGQAGSGKSIIQNSFPFNQILNKIYTSKYEEELASYKVMIKNNENEEELELDKPQLKVHTIPADTSSAALIEILNINGGMGNMIDTEADSFIGSKNQEWKNNDSVLRKIASNEPVQINRKGGGIIMVDKPRAGFLITGTPDQCISLFKGSIENGLVSRFLFFRLNHKELVFDKRVFDCSGFDNKMDSISDLALQHKELYEMVHQSDHVLIEIDKPEHIKILQEKFSGWHFEAIKIFGENIHATITRLAIAHKRIAAILTILRLYDLGKYDDSFLNNPAKSVKLSCDDESFRMSLEIIDVIRQHNFFVFQQLRALKNEEDTKPDYSTMRMFELYSNLPDTFKKKESIEIGEKLNYKERTVGKHLKSLVDKKLLESDGLGNYKKITLN